MTVGPNELPPIPRGRDNPDESELIPFASTKINVWKSKALLPLLLTGVVAVALFQMQDFGIEIELIGVFGVFLIFLGVYYYSGEAKQWWWYLIPCVLGYFLVETKSLFRLYAIPFRYVLPGNVGALKNSDGFIAHFVAHFFGAGLCEELVKATPALLALFLAYRLGGPSERPTPSLRQLFTFKASVSEILGAIAIRSPLDGLLMGAAAGAAFIISETLFEYIPNIIKQTMARSSNEAQALLAAFDLLIPRVLQGVSGHMAWAGIFGYFIGLSARYRSNAFRLLAIGWLVAAVLHALWNSVGFLPFALVFKVAVTVASVVMFVACLLKGKQLEIVWSGRASESDSILVAARPGAPSAPVPQGATPAGLASLFSGLAGAVGGLEKMAGATVRPQPSPNMPYVPPLPTAQPAAASRFSIGAGTSRFGLEAGRVIDFSALFGAMGAPAGTTGEIGHHPTDPSVLGLRNTGSAAWTAVTPDGATVSVPPGKNLRIVAGTRLILGPAMLDIQTY